MLITYNVLLCIVTWYLTRRVKKNHTVDWIPLGYHLRFLYGCEIAYFARKEMFHQWWLENRPHRAWNFGIRCNLNEGWLRVYFWKTRFDIFNFIWVHGGPLQRLHHVDILLQFKFVRLTLTSLVFGLEFRDESQTGNVKVLIFGPFGLVFCDFRQFLKEQAERKMKENRVSPSDKQM